MVRATAIDVIGGNARWKRKDNPSPRKLTIEARSEAFHSVGETMESVVPGKEVSLEFGSSEEVISESFDSTPQDIKQAELRIRKNDFCIFFMTKTPNLIY